MCDSWPFRFAPFFECPADPAVPCETSWNTALWLRSRAEHSETSVFAATFAASLHHVTTFESRQAHDLQVWYSFLLVLWWGETYCASNSLELDSRFYALVADWNTGLLWHNRTTFRFRNWVLVSLLCFHQLIPIGPLSHAFFPPQVGRLRRVPRCV